MIAQKYLSRRKPLNALQAEAVLFAAVVAAISLVIFGYSSLPTSTTEWIHSRIDNGCLCYDLAIWSQLVSILTLLLTFGSVVWTICLFIEYTWFRRCQPDYQFQLLHSSLVFMARASVVMAAITVLTWILLAAGLPYLATIL